MTFTFEELRPILYTIVGKYIRKFPKEDFDEVLNEIWASPQFQSITDIRQAWQAARWGLMGYIRRKIGIGCCGQPIKKRQAHLRSISELDEYYTPQLADKRNDCDAVDAADLEAWVCQWLNERDRLVIFYRFRGETWENIGNKLGLTKETVRQIFIRTQRKIRKRLSA